MMDGCIDGAAKSDYESDDEEMCDDGVRAVCYIKGGEECKMDAGKPSAGPGDSPPLKADPAWSPKTSQPEPGAAAPPPPPGFSGYKQNAGAGGVLGMIQNVINDAKTMEKEAIQAEQDSQGAYESFVKNTNDEIAVAQKSMVNKQENKAKAEEEHTQANADLKATMSVSRAWRTDRKSVV